MVSSWGVGKNSVFFKGLANGSLTMLQCVYRQNKLNLMGFYYFSLFVFFLWVCVQGWEGRPGRSKKWMWSGHIVFNSQVIKILCHEKQMKPFQCSSSNVVV